MPNATFEDEKPTFHTNQKPPGNSEPFQLSGSIQVPYTINRYLRDYQREGVKFIYDNYVKSRGCILGDDMGLGKTVQVISFLAAVLQKTGTWEDVKNNRPEFLQTQVPSKQSKVKKVFLIVSPLSVLYNWKDELDTWGHFKTVVVHGVRKEEELARVNRGRCEIALTTYETLRLCLDQFNSIDWTAVIVDEVHKLKNNKSQITQAMKELRCSVRVGLTGTILQNNLEELWCVMDWAVPGCLGLLGSFKNRFSDPIEQGQKHSATKRTLAQGRKAVQSLAKRLCRRFLRRTKALIRDQLPKKDDRVVYCALTDFQQTVYQAVLDTDDVKLLLQSSEKCPCRSGRSRRKCCFGLNSDRNLYFSYLAILRKVANHVALLQSREGTSEKQKKYVTAICEQVFKKFPEFSERCKQAAFEALSDPIYSGKMKVLQRLINHFITRKDKVLLFSLSTKLLDILESYCMAEGLEYRRLDGTTKSKDRIHIVKEFNSTTDINLCLVSTMAGGLGLNFVGANVVVLFDPTWNPANDLQAIDRAYRIGQCRDVKVFRFISLGTVEEIIYLRQIYKQQLQSSVIGKENARRYFEAVQGTEGQAGELFGIRNLFRFQTNGTCLTHRILEREGHVEVGIKTARTHAMDDGVQELDQGLASAHGSSGQTGGQAVTSARLSDPGVLDFSSASEDEDPCGSRSKATAPITLEEFGASTSSAANVNLCALLQKNLTHLVQIGSESSDESQSEENTIGSNLEEIKAAERKTECELYSDSEDERNTTSGIKFQEQDVLHHHNKARQNDKKVPNKEQRQNWARLAEQRRRWEKEIESFTSSEDEAPLKDVKSKNRHASSTQQNTSALQSHMKKHHAAPRKVHFTGLKSPADHSREVQLRECTSTGTIDTLLGGLQEVSYTHSNQKVVGSSRAENCISRSALRDVFELNKHSQLPANHLLDLSETQSGVSQSSESGKDEGQNLSGQKFHPKNLVTHSIRTSVQTNSAIISVGKTPAAVRKQQLKEMAQYFGVKSVHEFAEELVSSDSAQRLHKLREFYSHSSPDLVDVIQQTFPKPATELNPAGSTSTAARNMTRQSSSSKRSHVNSRNLQKPPNKEAAEEISVKKRRTKASSTTDLRPHSSGRSERTNQNFSSSEPFLKTSKENHQTTSSSEVGENLRDGESSITCRDSSAELAHFPKDDIAGTDSIHPNKNLINDLIGDTSILDDLFKPKKTADRPKSTTTPMSTPAGRTKNRGKDFWDILNEGNEESINKLTDPSQVEKMCRTVTVPAKSKCENSLESSQLWKKNEKFLWK
ncbi:DNA excision repair protein ERCC-6-like 2 [Trichomycterus rosablanca]|uniref:DNA excision repair protein ERCC-6-like 2 n=1 Tax=Trichomycterus rosablanca TaxID=2290929 RepID=UPI002F35A0FD